MRARPQRTTMALSSAYLHLFAVAALVLLLTAGQPRDGVAARALGTARVHRHATLHARAADDAAADAEADAFASDAADADAAAEAEAGSGGVDGVGGSGNSGSGGSNSNSNSKQLVVTTPKVEKKKKKFDFTLQKLVPSPFKGLGMGLDYGLKVLKEKIQITIGVFELMRRLQSDSDTQAMSKFKSFDWTLSDDFNALLRVVTEDDDTTSVVLKVDPLNFACIDVGAKRARKDGNIKWEAGLNTCHTGFTGTFKGFNLKTKQPYVNALVMSDAQQMEVKFTMALLFAVNLWGMPVELFGTRPFVFSKDLLSSLKYDRGTGQTQFSPPYSTLTGITHNGKGKTPMLPYYGLAKTLQFQTSKSLDEPNLYSLKLLERMVQPFVFVYAAVAQLLFGGDQKSPLLKGNTQIQSPIHNLKQSTGLTGTSGPNQQQLVLSDSQRKFFKLKRLNTGSSSGSNTVALNTAKSDVLTISPQLFGDNKNLIAEMIFDYAEKVKGLVDTQVTPNGLTVTGSGMHSDLKLKLNGGLELNHEKGFVKGEGTVVDLKGNRELMRAKVFDSVDMSKLQLSTSLFVGLSRLTDLVFRVKYDKSERLVTVYAGFGKYTFPVHMYSPDPNHPVNLRKLNQ